MVHMQRTTNTAVVTNRLLEYPRIWDITWECRSGDGQHSWAYPLVVGSNNVSGVTELLGHLSNQEGRTQVISEVGMCRADSVMALLYSY